MFPSERRERGGDENNCQWSKHSLHSINHIKWNQWMKVDPWKLAQSVWCFSPIVSVDKPPTPLAEYSTGPRLLLTPVSTNQSDCREWSCDAWLLWKPEVINASVFTKMMSQQLKVANDEGKESGYYTITSNPDTFVHSQPSRPVW